MVRYTTPTHNFLFPADLSAFEAVKITYAQGGVIKLEKDKDDLVIDRNRAQVHLTQEETASFVPGCPVEIQVRLKTTQNEVLATSITNVSVEDVINKEVM